MSLTGAPGSVFLGSEISEDLGNFDGPGVVDWPPTVLNRTQRRLWYVERRREAVLPHPESSTLDLDIYPVHVAPLPACRVAT